MASSDSPATAKGNADAAIYDVDSVMATTLAALGNPSIPYKKMAAVDPKKRTEFAWQHRFRKWRSAAKDLMSAHPEVLEGGIVTPSTCATKKTPASKRKSAQKVDDATDDNEINSGTEDGVRKVCRRCACTEITVDVVCFVESQETGSQQKVVR